MTSIPDLRKLSRDLRRRSSEAIYAPTEHVPARIRRLLALVDQADILAEKVDAAPEPERDPLQELDECREQLTRLPLPDDELEHLGFLHQLLRRLSDDEAIEEATGHGELWRLCRGYGGMDQDSIDGWVREVLDDTVKPYAGYLAQVVSNALIDADAEDPESRSVNIEVRESTAAMVNVANDESAIDAQQEVRTEAAEVIEAAQRLMQVMQQDEGLPDDLRSDLEDVTSRALDEVTGKKPDADVIDRLSETVEDVATRIEQGTRLAAAARALVGAMAKLGAVLNLPAIG